MTDDLQLEDDLEAEIENFLLENEDLIEDDEEGDDSLIEPIWISELRQSLADPNIDSDSLRYVLDRNVLPATYRLECWQILLGTKGKTSSYQKESNPEMRNHELEKATRKLGSKQAIGERIIGYYLNSKSISNFDQSRDSSMIDILEALLKFDLQEEDIFNLFYSIHSKYMPKLSDALETVLDLLIQFYDPLLYRFLKSTQRDIARRAVHWIKSLFRSQLTNDDVTNSLWDIIFQSVDPLLPLWISLVFIFNSRDELMTNENREQVPNFESIEIDDVEDIIQLSNFYKTNTPKSFTQSIISSIYPPSNRSKKNLQSSSSDFRDSFILSISAKELVQNVLDGKSEIILDIRSNNLFESEHLIGSLRLTLVIENGLIDSIKMNQSLAKFKSTIMGDLNKDDEDEIPFITLIGTDEEASTLFTTSNELIKLGFVGVSTVRGGFEAVKYEVEQVGSEELLLWRDLEKIAESGDGQSIVQQLLPSRISPPSGSEIVATGSSWFSSAISTINSTLDKVLTIEDDLGSIDDQF